MAVLPSIPSIFKVEMGDRDRLLMHRLTEALTRATEELRRYNDAGEKAAGVGSSFIRTLIPPNDTEYDFIGKGKSNHRWTELEEFHTHETVDELVECINRSRNSINMTDAGIH